MKKVLALLMALVMLLGTCLAEGGQTAYQNPAKGFSFTHPAGWTVSSETEKGCTFSGYDDNLVVAAEVTNVGAAVTHDEFLSVYAPMLINQYAQQYPGMETMEAGRLITVGGQEYVEQIISLEMQGTWMNMNLYYKMVGSDMYIIGFTVAKEQADAYAAQLAADIECVLASFVPAGGAQAPVTGEAPAQAADGVLSYTHTRGGYSFSYPDDMWLMSQDNVQEMLDSMTSEDYAMKGLDASVLQQNAEQIRKTDMTMVMYGTGEFNFNVVYQNVGVTLNNELVLTALCPQFITQYQAIYPDLTMADEGSIYTVGDKEYVTQSLQVNAGGYDMTIVVLYAVNGTYLYNATFTVADLMLTEDFMAYVNGVVELFASSFEAFAPAAQ